MCSVDGIMVDEVDKEVNKEVDKEVDNKMVRQEVFKRLLAKKLIMGLNKLCRPLRTPIASNL